VNENQFLPPVSSWRIPRPFEDALSCFDWAATIGSDLVTWRLVTDWTLLINPGDRIDGIDLIDYGIYQSGVSTFLKILRIRDMLSDDIVQFFPVEYREKVKKHITPVDVARIMASFYNEPVTLDTLIVVIGMKLDYAKAYEDCNSPDGTSKILSKHFIPLEILN